jgi:predicted lipid-binding transport protein (Tim44 family)
MEIIIYAVIAAFLAYRLYTVLGQRGDTDRQRPNPFSIVKPPENHNQPRPDRPQRPDRDDEDVLAFPVNRAPRPDDGYDNPLAASALPAPESLAGGLYAIRAADPNFDDKQFMKGARMAFEMIVHAFAAGERDALKNLMSSRLYDSFASAIDAREMAGEKLDMKMLHVRDADIIAARMDGDNAMITVQYVSDQRKDVLARDGSIKDVGSLEQMTDTWTYRRNVKNSDPNWTLVETRSA